MIGSNFEEQQFFRVADFYNGKSVFVTGTTGFVGTVLLEILLRCFPGIKAIYILIRTKKDVPPEFRKEEIFNKKIFKKLREENREYLDKVHVIPGDNSLPNLGLSDEDAQLLIDEVSIVFHCAAIISFMRPLRFILGNNVLSLNNIIELCRKMRNFEALVYTSTAYSNCNHTNFIIKEEFYRLPFRAEKFLDALKNDDNEKLLELFGHCKPDWQNAYLFSKCLAENVIMDTAWDLPVVIIRPSVVFCTVKQPAPGYGEEHSGGAALAIGAGKGFIKVVHTDPKVRINLVPADIVAKAHVLAAWAVGTKRCTSPFIVNCTANENFQLKLSENLKIMKQVNKKFPLPKSYSENKHVFLVRYRYLYYILAAYYHYLPAAVLDGLLKIFGKKPRIYSLYRFYDRVMSYMIFFMFNTVEFERNNMEYLDKLIHPEDRKDLTLDYRDVTFKELSLKIPENSAVYDWNTDKRSPKERQKIKYMRYLLILSIQGMFVMIVFLLICWIIYLIVSNLMTVN